METQTIMNSVISLFLIMLAGVYGRKRGFLNKDTIKGLTDILLEIALPCMIITAFSMPYDEHIKSNIIKAFYLSFIAYILVAVISKLLILPVMKHKKRILHFANIFTNTGYIGFPILNSIYGTEGVMYGSIFNMFFVVFLWTYGIMLFQGKMNRQEVIAQVLKALYNPSLIAVYIGVLMMVFNLKMPRLISVSTSAIGGITGPISMLLVGGMAFNISIKEHLRDWTIYYGVTTKLIIIPAMLYFMSSLVSNRSIVMNSIIILAAMPAAAMTSIFADRFNTDRGYAAVLVVATTLLSVFTLPVLIKILFTKM